MNITVILCTYNRCQGLTQALESVAASVLPESVVWEVLVVDNNSPDRTRDVVEGFCRTNPPGRFRYLFEARQGLSNARNAGIREAHGEIVAFMDDDVTVEPDWLRNLTACLEGGEWAGAGGRVRPPRDFTPPPWFTLSGPMDVGGPLAWFDLGDLPGDLKKPPYGTNMAFRKSVFEKYTGFRTDLGRCGTSLMSNEDTEFGERLMAGGERLRYEPSAVVYHPVSPERLSMKYLRAWWFAYGRALVRQFGKRPPVRGIPVHYISIFSRTLRWMFTRESKRRFWWKTRIWISAGEIVEIYHRSRAASAPQAEEAASRAINRNA
jgi:glycosyltransferase involved in cell wall biosynthesis